MAHQTTFSFINTITLEVIYPISFLRLQAIPDSQQASQLQTSRIHSLL